MNISKTIACIAIGILETASSFGDGGSFSDSDAKADLEYYWSLMHPEDFGGLVDRAYSKCDSDRDRFSRILGEFAIEKQDFKNGLASRWAICKIADFGSTNSLPFLYSYATNPICGDCAIKSIIAIEGVSSNSISLVSQYLESNIATSQKSSIPADLCGEFVRKTVSSGLSQDVMTNALGVVYAFAKLRNTGHTWLDRNLINADPSYRFSKRRLCIMRTIANRILNDYQTNYVTNAINELVAYPESELPD